MKTSILKSPITQNKHSIKTKNPAGNLFEEINEQDMSLVAGGTNNWVSNKIAKRRGLGGDGAICTVSAECRADKRRCN
jgi:hypothetical protein